MLWSSSDLPFPSYSCSLHCYELTQQQTEFSQPIESLLG